MSEASVFRIDSKHYVRVSPWKPSRPLLCHYPPSCSLHTQKPHDIRSACRLVTCQKYHLSRKLLLAEKYCCRLPTLRLPLGSVCCAPELELSCEVMKSCL